MTKCPTDASTSSPTSSTTLRVLDRCDYRQHWADTLAWLQRLRLLVERQTDFTALKFANYQEAELQLFRRMPELRSVSQEARRICRGNPKASSQVAGRINQIQSAWLAVESRLAEFKTQKSLLSALSGDLKLLKTLPAPRTMDADKQDHVCCMRLIEILDDTVRKKTDQIQLVLNVTSAVSKLLDLVCSSDLMPCGHGRHMTDSPSAQTAEVATGAEVARHVQTVWSIDSTTADQFAVRKTHGDDGSSASSESSEIIVQAGLGSAATAGQSDNHNAVHQPEYQDATDELLTSIPEDTPRASAEVPPLSLQMVAERIAAFKHSIQTVQASDLLATEDFESVEFTENAALRRLSQVAVVEATLSDWQMELVEFRVSVQQVPLLIASAGSREAIIRRVYLESIAVLDNWIGLLRDRFRGKRMELLADGRSAAS